jgi:predicted O-methyltransferase YrrM
MIDLNHCNEWQHRDETGMILPWYTKSFLDELVTWELSDKHIFEFGCGASTLWFATKRPVVYGVENNREYREAVLKELGRRSHEIDFYIGHDLERPFQMFGSNFHPSWDIIIVDCEPVEYRDKCIEKAVSHLNVGGKLIVDNWDQPSVWVPSNQTRRLLADWPVKIYRQEGHPDWQTALFTKP